MRSRSPLPIGNLYVHHATRIFQASIVRVMRRDREWHRIVAVLALVLVPVVFIAIGSFGTANQDRRTIGFENADPTLPKGVTRADVRRWQDILEAGDFCYVGLFPGSLRLDHIRGQDTLIFSLSAKGLQRFPRANSHDYLLVNLKTNNVVDLASRDYFRQNPKDDNRFKGFYCER